MQTIYHYCVAEFSVGKDEFIKAVLEECAAVKVDYDPDIDDDLEQDFYNECSKIL